MSVLRSRGVFVKANDTDRMIRLLHTTASFLIVAAAYLVYAATVVPLVEPQRRGPGSIDHDGYADELFAPESKYAPLFEAIFPADHWTRTNPPKVFEADQGMFVFLDYQTYEPGEDSQGDNRLRVEPCVMIYFPTPWSRGTGPPPADCIVLEAPQGGVVELDGPIEVFKKLPRPKNAWLTGPVVIKSDMDQLGPEDDLEITTHDVVVNERGIFSEAAVELHLGPHRGTGHTLDVRFLADASGNDPDSLHVDGIQWIQLLRDVRLVLQADGRTSSPALGLPDDRGLSAIGSESTGQIELTCDGPLFVDVPQRVAEFERDVEVFFIHASGPSDRLACENLQVAFADRRQAFQPIRFVATGQPVTVTSTLREFHARCRKLDYDVLMRKLTFDALPQGNGAPTDTIDSSLGAQRLATAATEPDQVCDVQFGPHRLAAPRIEYTLDARDPRGRLGMIRISGAGRLVGASERDGSSQPFEATWHEGLQLTRQDDQPVLSLFGRPEIEGLGLGRLAAGVLHVWLRESAPEPAAGAGVAVGQSPQTSDADGKTQVMPDRLLARDNVAIDSPQLTARIGQLEAWLVSADGSRARASADGGPASRPFPQHGLFGAASNEAAGPQSAYYVESDRLQIRALLPQHPSDEERPHVNVTHLTLIGSVLLEERRQAQQRVPSVRIEADRLEAADIHTASMYVSAAGKPVGVHADGKTIRGGEIHFDQATNRFDVPTPGDLTLTVDHDLERRPLANPNPLTVSWQGRLHFDGKEAVLTDGILVSTPEQRLQTQKLVATLRTPISLGRLDVKDQVDFERLECTGGVILDRLTFDAGGLASQEHAEFPNLTIERNQNLISALGPGWLRHVSLGRSDPLSEWSGGRTNAMSEVVPSPLGRSARASAASMDDTDECGLTFLRVDFQRAMHGNLETRDVAFEGQVRCVQGPVASWDESLHVEGLTQLPEDTFIVNSSTFRVGQRQTQATEWREIEAEGNVEVEGGLGESGNFFARGARLTYDQRKDLLILDGGAGMAELFHEKAPGTQPLTLTQRTIHVSPRRKYVHSSGFSQSSGGY